MGPGAIVVNVRAKTERSYYRGDRLWAPEWQPAHVDQELFDLIKIDEFLEVKEIAPTTQARMRLELAEAEYAAAQIQKEAADRRYEAACKVLEQARDENERLGPEPPAGRAPTPFTDAMRAFHERPGTPRQAPAPLGAAAVPAPEDQPAMPVIDPAPPPAQPAKRGPAPAPEDQPAMPVIDPAPPAAPPAPPAAAPPATGPAPSHDPGKGTAKAAPAPMSKTGK